MTAPRVSVIVPAYNYAHFLGEALESVVAQTMSDWECVVVDDGSTDNTLAVAEAWTARDSRIRYIRQKNAGPSTARNNGIRQSSGAYLQFLDADDRLAPEKFEAQAAWLDVHQEVDILIGPAAFFRTETPHEELQSLHGGLSKALAPRIAGTDEARLLLEHYNITVISAPLVRRSVVERAGFFNERITHAEDWDLWLRCGATGARFGYLDHARALALIRTHSDSASRSTDRFMRDLIVAGSTFPPDAPLPRVYDMAAGIGDFVTGRHRLRGARRIFRAARSAEVTLWKIRWLAYAAAALVLPRRFFWWVVTRPMPERGLELLRRFGRARV